MSAWSDARDQVAQALSEFRDPSGNDSIKDALYKMFSAAVVRFYQSEDELASSLYWSSAQSLFGPLLTAEGAERQEILALAAAVNAFVERSYGGVEKALAKRISTS